MKLKLSKIREAADVIASIKNKSFPIKVSYAIAKNASILQKECLAIEESRQKLCVQYARKDENGDPVTINDCGAKRFDFSEEGLREFSQEYLEFLETETEVEGLHQISLNDIEKYESISKYDTLTAGEIASLDFIFTE